jgi:CMP-2-keto-3-deoxyoctulosonic acid synthetase
LRTTDVMETLHDTMGVDAEEDLRRVEEHFRRLQRESER